MEAPFFLAFPLRGIPLLGEMSRSIYADVTKGSRFRQKEVPSETRGMRCSYFSIAEMR